jgi:hypothetical protein
VKTRDGSEIWRPVEKYQQEGRKKKRRQEYSVRSSLRILYIIKFYFKVVGCISVMGEKPSQLGRKSHPKDAKLWGLNDVLLWGLQS